MSILNSSNTSQQTESMVEFNAIYALEPKVILKKLIQQEIEKSGEKASHLTTFSMSIKRGFLLILFGLITFSCSTAYFFYTPLPVCAILIALTALIILFFFRKLALEKELYKKLLSHPDADIHSVVLDSLERSHTTAMPPVMMFFLTAALAVAIPMVLFYQPKVLYSPYENGYMVTRYTKGIRNPEEVTIPSTYMGEPVLAIDSGAFQNSIIQSVSLPQSITYIGGEAFSHAVNLEQIQIPYQVTVIKGNTFESCKNLQAVYLSEYTTSIHAYAFKDCRSLATITLPDGITEIKGNTFENCSSLTSIKIPEGVTRIGGHAFYGCYSLEDVYIPSTILEIGSSAFRSCVSLMTIKIPEETFINERAFKDSPTTIERY